MFCQANQPNPKSSEEAAVRGDHIPLRENRTAPDKAVSDDRQGERKRGAARENGRAERGADKGAFDAAAAVGQGAHSADFLHDAGQCEAAGLCALCQRQKADALFLYEIY